MRVLLFSVFTASALVCPSWGSLERHLPESLLPNIELVIDSALVESEAMRDREYIEKEAEGRRMAYRSAVLPRFHIDLSYNQEDEIRSNSDGFEERLVYSVGLTQPLYHWGARQSEKEIGTLSYEIEQLNTESTVELLRAGTRARYLNLVLSRYSYQIAQDALELKQELYRTEQAREQSGQVSAARLRDLELELESLEVDRLLGEGDYRDALRDLADFTGMESEVVESLAADEVPEFDPMSPEEIRTFSNAFRATADSNEDLARLERNIELQRLRLNIENVALRPKLDFQLGATQNARDFNGVRREEEYVFAGVRASWDIFDGFRRKGRTLEAMSRLERVEASRESLLEQLEREFARSLRSLEVSSRRLSISERQLDRKVEDREFSAKEFEAGRLSEAEFESAELAFRREKLNAQRSRVNYLQAVARVHSLIGR